MLESQGLSGWNRIFAQIASVVSGSKVLAQRIRSDAHAARKQQQTPKIKPSVVGLKSIPSTKSRTNSIRRVPQVGTEDSFPRDP